MTNQTLVHGAEAGHWEQAIYAFLAEKERRSGSKRTVETYSRMLFHFFGTVGKTPNEVTPPESDVAVINIRLREDPHPSKWVAWKIGSAMSSG